jgi:hypothetical protein
MYNIQWKLFIVILNITVIYCEYCGDNAKSEIGAPQSKLCGFARDVSCSCQIAKVTITF